ncbi:hypothetical protein KM1_158340 [Entamoeba histolytica HM-3:IMSS]|uniref:Uncharacterized protein n=1 Tax=Entamoeba histolytica HM-3:IMSS TaxID=885315 RepID=M7WZD4_ENTHI|nr:hypothetical protein KM1_158340 [Entamoeba histolytica HM-3:IMSS]
MNEQSNTSSPDVPLLTIPVISSIPFGDSFVSNKLEMNNLFVGMYIIEFDNVSGEKIAYKQLTHPMNSSVEKELIGMMMGADYYGYAPVTLLLNTITNYHVVSIHFTCYNPSNKRGFVTTCCIAIIQTIPFTSSQVNLLTERLTQLSSKLQSIALKLHDTSISYSSILSLEELIDSTDPTPSLFKRVVTGFAYNLLSTHFYYSVLTDFINLTHPSHIIASGGHSLFNWSFASHTTLPFHKTYKNTISSQQKPLTKSDSIDSNISEYTISENSLNPPFPPCTFLGNTPEPNDFDYQKLVSTYSSCFPNILFSLLSGLQCIVYSSEKYDISKLIAIAKFLSSLCIGGVSSQPSPNIQIVDKQEALLPLQLRFIQIFVICEPTVSLESPLHNLCYLDVSKGFYGLKYGDDMKNSLLDSFVKYALNKKKFLAQKMWNVMVEYSQLTMRCFIYPELHQKIINTSERYIIANFQRKIEQEKLYLESKQLIYRLPVISKNMFVYVPLE